MFHVLFCFFCKFFKFSSLLVSGVVHPGICAGVSAGKVYEEGLFWSVESCRNGGRDIFYVQLIHRDVFNLEFIARSL